MRLEAAVALNTIAANTLERPAIIIEIVVAGDSTVPCAAELALGCPRIISMLPVDPTRASLPGVMGVVKYIDYCSESCL